MKIKAFTLTLLAATALVGGPALAQATMQPIPNPPEKAKMMHGKKSMHHGKKHHMKAKMKADKMAADPAPAAPK